MLKNVNLPTVLQQNTSRSKLHVHPINKWSSNTVKGMLLLWYYFQSVKSNKQIQLLVPAKTNNTNNNRLLIQCCNFDQLLYQQSSPVCKGKFKMANTNVHSDTIVAPDYDILRAVYSYWSPVIVPGTVIRKL